MSRSTSDDLAITRSVWSTHSVVSAATRICQKSTSAVMISGMSGRKVD
jgi:hypothetical protein